MSFRWAADMGLISMEDASAIRAVGARVIDEVESGEPWWLEWKDWAPDPSWRIPTLPDGWDQV